MPKNQNIKTLKFLFIFRVKFNQLDYLCGKGIKYNTKEFYQEYDFLKIIQSGWVKAVKNKQLIYNNNYLLSWLRHFLPYKIWLKISIRCQRIKICQHLEKVLLNIIILFIAVLRRIEAVCYYDKDIAKVTEKILHTMKVIIIEYDGRSPMVSKRDFSQEINIPGKYLVSNMNIAGLIGHKKDYFRQIILGIDEDISREINFSNRNTDILFVGGFDSRIFPKRCGIINEFLKMIDKGAWKIKFYGYKKNVENYPFIAGLGLKRIYGRDYIKQMKQAKISIVIPSDDHLRISSGMPMRFFENAALGIMQLVFKTKAIANTDFKNQEDFIFFNNTKELKNLIEYYRDHDKERIQIAKNAYKKYNESYTAQKEFKKLIKSIYLN